MIDAMRSPSPECELAALELCARPESAKARIPVAQRSLGRDGRAAAMPDASVPLSRREAHAPRKAVQRPCAGRKRPRRARFRFRTREIRASVI